MFLIVLLFAIHDSIPPLPDLSKSEFPEPELWKEQMPRSLRINGYAGQFFGGNIDLDLRYLSLAGRFSRTSEWDSTDTGDASLSHSIFWPRFWLKPKLRASLVRREERYSSITPGFEFNLFTPSFVTTGVLDYSRWQLNSERVHEAVGGISLTFDRLSYMPQLEITGIYTESKLKPSLGGQFNVGNFRLELGSLVNAGFPSPQLSITYSEPRVNMTAGFSSGVRYSTLSSLYRPEIPIRYPTSIPAETLSLAADIVFELDFGDHQFALGGSYKEWLCRLNIGNDFMISQTQSVIESNLNLSTRNIISVGRFRFRNRFRISYNTSDSALVFKPDYAATDTLTVSIAMIELCTDAQYTSERTGIERPLPAYYTMNTTLGLKLSFLKFYLAIHNITDDRSEIYDDYFLTGRKYAGGVEIVQQL